MINLSQICSSKRIWGSLGVTGVTSRGPTNLGLNNLFLVLGFSSLQDITPSHVLLGHMGSFLLVRKMSDQLALLLDLVEQSEQRCTVLLVVFPTTVSKNAAEMRIEHGIPQSPSLKVIQDGLDSRNISTDILILVVIWRHSFDFLDQSLGAINGLRSLLLKECKQDVNKGIRVIRFVLNLHLKGRIKGSKQEAAGLKVIAAVIGVKTGCGPIGLLEHGILVETWIVG